ncbi:MAG: glycosyltransferase family 4 protein [Methylococcaceae bacterium]|nr:glycosyltransferase family 4 protein [Methylococcaceae bacterium]
MTRPRPKLLFFVTEDWYFCSHRLPLALAAQQAGFEVCVLTRVREHGERIRRAGLKLIPLELSRRGTNPLAELGLLLRLIAIYRREQPDLIHQVAIKPVLYGSLAARLAGIPHVVNAIAGLGWLFTSPSTKARLLGHSVVLAFRLLLNRGKLIVQNPNDLEFLLKLGIPPSRIALIQGSGVDVLEFSPSPEPSGPPLVMLPSRQLWDKGIGEFVAAARRLKNAGIAARFVLVGAPDAENPAAISERQLALWQQEGIVEYWGHRTDMAQVFSQAHIVCLPSYREGLPKALIEAAAAGRPIVTTDVPGCREVVRDGENGLLVPVKAVEALADALTKLIEDSSLRARMGAKGREMAVESFSQERICAETLALYRQLL